MKLLQKDFVRKHSNGKQILGLKFRRQHPILTYILDFYCHQLKLGIEIDGDHQILKKEHAKNTIKEVYGII
ncbi:MAG: DUF559 domain-containing protein [Saprospiraceae bacterium]|nr:DUF559 domain-containing protein [Saprospiraceae bacterium]